MITNEINSLEAILDQKSIQSLRKKDLTAFLVGYAIRDLMCLSDNSGEVLGQKIPLTEVLEIFSEKKLTQKSGFVSKRKLIQVFGAALCVTNKIFQKYCLKQKNFTIIYNRFIQLFDIGLGMSQTGLNPSALQQKFRHHSQNKQIQTNQQISHSKSLETIHQQQSLQRQVCEICCIQLLDQSPINEIQLNNTIIIHKCGHRFHQSCILEMIRHHMNQNSSILLKRQQQSNTFQSENSIQYTLTLLKCPNFQKCSTYLSFSEVHVILLHSKRNMQKHSLTEKMPLLQKLHSIAFNDYINSKSVIPFNEVLKSFKVDQIDQNKHNTDFGILFFCQTKGCNGIYEIQSTLIMKIFMREPCVELQCFSCLSCRQSFCLLCFSSIHPSMTCKQFSISSNYLPEDFELQKFMKTLRRPYMKCPKCHFYVDNWRGCSTINCRCGIRFCYKCGGTQCPYAKCLKELGNQGKN